MRIKTISIVILFLAINGNAFPLTPTCDSYAAAWMAPVDCSCADGMTKARVNLGSKSEGWGCLDGVLGRGKGSGFGSGSSFGSGSGSSFGSGDPDMRTRVGVHDINPGSLNPWQHDVSHQVADRWKLAAKRGSNSAATPTTEAPSRTFFVSSMLDDQLVCGEATIPIATADWLESFSHLSEGTCSANGFSSLRQSKLLRVPSVGDIALRLYGHAGQPTTAPTGVDEIWSRREAFWEQMPLILKGVIFTIAAAFFISTMSIIVCAALLVSFLASRCSRRFRALSKPKKAAISLAIVASPFCPLVSLLFLGIIGVVVLRRLACGRSCGRACVRSAPDQVLRSAQTASPTHVPGYTQFDHETPTAPDAPPQYAV